MFELILIIVTFLLKVLNGFLKTFYLQTLNFILTKQVISWLKELPLKFIIL